MKEEKLCDHLALIKSGQTHWHTYICIRCDSMFIAKIAIVPVDPEGGN